MPNRTRNLTKPMTVGRDHERILLIADDADEAATVLGELGSVTEESFQVEWVTDLSSGIERLRTGGVATIVFDLNLPGCLDVECFDRLFQAAAGIPILILSEPQKQELARQAVRRGAQDYLLREQADGYRLRRTVRSIMDRREADATALENDTASATLNSIGEAILRTDIRGIVTYLNRSAERMTGWPREQALGRPAAEVLKLIDNTSGEAVDNGVATVLKAGKDGNAPLGPIHCTLVRRNGVEVGIENRATAVRDRFGEAIAVVMSIRDVSVDRAASLEASRVAQHDALTNLPNRTLFNDRLVQAISLAER
jgi:PAS domain S-box-containing protein